jgi:hypothetical protein
VPRRPKNLSRIKAHRPVFIEQEQIYVLEFRQKDGQLWPPLRLQLVGKILLEDKNGLAIDNPSYYHPQDLDYWRDFERHLEGKYKGQLVYEVFQAHLELLADRTFQMGIVLLFSTR